MDLVLAYGEPVQAGQGRRLYRIQRKEMRYLATDCPPLLWKRFRDSLKNMAMVTDDGDQTIITAMHRQTPIRNDWLCWRSKDRSR